MLKIGSFITHDFAEIRQWLIHYFKTRIVATLNLSVLLKEQIFPKHFLSNSQYLLFPLFFRKCFTCMPRPIVYQLCVSGYLYFKYLLCIDALIDKDIGDEHENAISEDVLLIRSHICHEESIRILSHIFGQTSPFWKKWKVLSENFVSSLVLDKVYNPAVDFATYKKLAEGKCSFLKASVDAFFHYSSSGDETLYNAIITSMNHLAVGRCLQDDVEDFKKDVIHKKNNYAHNLLYYWLKERNKSFNDYSPLVLEKYFYISKVAEKALQQSKDVFNQAIQAVLPYRSSLDEYIKHLEALRNKTNFTKVNIEAYRVSKCAELFKSTSLIQQNSVPEAITKALTYISNMQNENGSWHEASNKQGLSNVWATAFISMNIPEDNAGFLKAVDFLMATQRRNLWGYNTDWVSDFDSSTCSMIVLHKAGKSISEPLKEWIIGQHRNGGFPTYAPDDAELAGYFGVKNNNLLKGWTSPHVCVSALAYYGLSMFPSQKETVQAAQKLKSFIINSRTHQKMWKPYWWSSFIYPTVFAVKALLNENAPENEQIANEAIEYVLSRQLEDGSFACDTLQVKSVFYTAMVMEMLCQSASLFSHHSKSIKKMKDWLLTRQFENGAFESGDFLLIPPFHTTKPSKMAYKPNPAGGTGSITGEISGLFSTATALKALSIYEQMKTVQL